MSAKSSNLGKAKMKWTPEEDSILKEIISWHGPNNWDAIATHIKGRTGKQCRERWTTSLAPSLKKTQWTSDEDNIIIKMQRGIGNQWATMCRYLPGRSSIAIKNRFKTLKRHGYVTSFSEKPTVQDQAKTSEPENSTSTQPKLPLLCKISANYILIQHNNK